MKIINIKELLSLFLLLSALLFGGCGTAMLSDAHLAKQAKSQFSQMKKAEKLSNNASYKSMVNRIGKRIAGVAQVDLPGTEWEFVVFDKNEANAFAMPGGKVGVNSGLITLANGNEDEVAAVIGHEVAHVALRHSNKRMSQAIGIGLGGLILETAIRNKSETRIDSWQEVHMGLARLLAWLFLTLVQMRGKLITGDLIFRNGWLRSKRSR